MGTLDQNNPLMANGHEAQRRLVALLPSNDPTALAERTVHSTDGLLLFVLADSMKTLDTRIDVGADGGHVFVKNNYLVGGACGTIWAFVLQQNGTRRYENVPAQGPGGVCQ
jgi:hypothetical protein